MVIIPPVTFAIVFVLVSTSCNGNPAPGLRELKENTNSSAPSHITGGGINTVGGPNINSSMENRSASRWPRSSKNIQGKANNNRKSKAKVLNEAKTGDKKAYSCNRKNKSSVNLRKLLRILPKNSSALNETQFIGRIPTLSPRANVSARPTCPNGSADSWWPGHEDNLRSTCPWVYKEKYLGPEAYPRYVREADCLCDLCIDSTGLGCLDVRQTFTYFIIQGCQKGLALMNQVNTTITVGCHCANAMPPLTTTPAPIPSVTPTNDLD